ncbi:MULTISPECIES: hypothetical protein [unclassified Exiguobacterium]|uniref:hypothetical protein n=1 Tax=unclassified Exiguobacterium TaxID=2644629 RepID=UPI001BEB117F|nr:MULTISPECIES: hypothetical protein [unclassified Exiguobacterium]
MILLYFIYESITFLAIQQYLFSGWMILVVLTVSFSLANAHDEVHYSQRFGFELLVPGVGNLLRKNFIVGLATIITLIIIHFMYMFRTLPLETALLLTFSISTLSFLSLFIRTQKKADR